MDAVLEYTGQLIGGPLEGEGITASLPRVPVTVTHQIWLDGKKEDKEATVKTVTGVYRWNEQGFFIWNIETIDFETRAKRGTE